MYRGTGKPGKLRPFPWKGPVLKPRKPGRPGHPCVLIALANSPDAVENMMMNNSIAGKVLNNIDAGRERIIDLITELVRIETPTMATSAHAGIHKVLAREFSGLGYDCFIRSGKTSGGVFYSRPAERRKNAGLQLLLGHCDTVWDIGTLENDIPLKIEGDLLKGPGAYDMKAGIAQMIFALKALRELEIDPPLTPVVLITSDEELGSDDSVKLIRSLAKKAGRVLIPEPSYGDSGALKISRKGVGRYDIRITGKAAHSGLEPEKGISAVVVLADVIRELNALNDFPRGVSVNVGKVSGGTRENVVPASSRALVDVRVRTTADAVRIDGAIRSLKPSLPGAAIEVTGGIDRPPMERTEANLRLWRTAGKIGKELGLDLEGVESGGASDGNFTSEFAATLDGLGAVGGGAHALHEFIRLDKVTERTALLALLIAAEAGEQ